ncbi:hypothetical protein LEP1GSC122_1930 [Leptospira kirschneri serovar Valbuzzi str. 200702274]|nr:hypothetical protein LEP1GSC122_1930 [Leptospira kirschneri serovar Valbuzzi str. 200702274]
MDAKNFFSVSFVSLLKLCNELISSDIFLTLGIRKRYNPIHAESNKIKVKKSKRSFFKMSSVTVSGLNFFGQFKFGFYSGK